MGCAKYENVPRKHRKPFVRHLTTALAARAGTECWCVANNLRCTVCPDLTLGVHSIHGAFFGLIPPRGPISRGLDAARSILSSWHAQQGTPLFALQEMGGWESMSMMRRYAHLSAEHLALYADRLDTLRVVENPADGTNLAQAENDKGLHDASP